MRRSLINLYVLLTLPIRPPWVAIWCSVIALAVYFTVLPIEGWLRENSLSPLQLALTASFAARIYQNMGRAINAPRVVEAGLSVAITVFAATLIFVSLPLFAPTDLWVQHGITVYFLISFLQKAIALWVMPDILPELMGEAPHSVHQNILQWTMVSLASLALLNEMFIRYSGSQTEWVTAFAVTPVLMYYLQCWTIFATTSDEDFDD